MCRVTHMRQPKVNPSWEVGTSGDIDGKWWREWDAMNADGGRHPGRDSVMTRVLLKYFGANALPVKLVGSQGNLAMTFADRVSRIRWAVFQPSQAPVPQLTRDVRVKLRPSAFRALLGELSPIALAMDIARDDPMFGSLDDGGQESALVQIVPYGTTFSVLFPVGFEAYWKTRNGNLRQNIGRYFRRLEKSYGGWRFETVTDSSRISHAVDKFGEIESAGWKGAAGSAVHPENAQGHFYKELLTEFSVVGDACVYLLHVAGNVVAARLAVRRDNMILMLKSTFDESMKGFAPGRLLTYLALQNIADSGWGRRVEFYTRANRDALEWSTERRVLNSATVYRNVALTRVSGVIQRARRYRRVRAREPKSEE